MSELTPAPEHHPSKGTRGKRLVSKVDETQVKRRKTFSSRSSALVEQGSTAHDSDFQTAKMPSGPTKGWAQYIFFTEEAQIGAFDQALFPIPARGSHIMTM